MFTYPHLQCICVYVYMTYVYNHGAYMCKIVTNDCHNFRSNLLVSYEKY